MQFLPLQFLRLPLPQILFKRKATYACKASLILSLRLIIFGEKAGGKVEDFVLLGVYRPFSAC